MRGAVAAKLAERVERANSLLCIGLDPELEKLPERFRREPEPQWAFNRWIVEQTHEYAAAYKPNTAFYEARGAQGLEELRRTMEHVRAVCPEAVTICDSKRGDIGNTNTGYARFCFDWLGCDAVTVHPYLGREALAPFLEREDKAAIVLCRTSNPGAGELQDLRVDGGKPLWEVVAERVSRDWNTRGNCMLVVGATYPGEMRRVRLIAPALPLLVPGVGAQGGHVRAAVQAGMDAHGAGLLLSSSRGILFSNDPGGAARGLRDEINEARAALAGADGESVDDAAD